MAQARTRETHTDLPTAAVGTPAAPAATPNSVTLSTGQVVELRETNALDDMRVESLMTEMGIAASLQGVGALTYYRCCALSAIIKIDSEAVTPPQSAGEMTARLLRFKSPDALKIVTAYSAMNGLSETGAATF